MAVSLAFDLFAHDRQVVHAFERLADKAERAEGALRDIGGVDAFGGLVGEVQVAALAVEHAFKDAARDADRALRGIGDDVAAGITRRRGDLIRAIMTPDPQVARALAIPFASAIANPIGLALAAALGGLAVSLIGPALLSGLTLGLGGGLVAIGAFALHGSKVLKDSFTDAGTTIGGVLARAAKPLEGPFAAAIKTVAGLFVRLEPTLKRIFTALAPAIAPVVAGFVTLAEQVVPQLEAAMPAVVAAFKALGETLPTLAPAFIGLFRLVGSNRKEIAGFLKGLVGLARWIIGTGIPALILVSKAFARTAALQFALTKAVVGGTAAIAGAVARMVSAVLGWFGRLRSGVVARVQALMGFIRSIPGRIRGALAGLGGLLFSAGVAVISGLIAGIRSQLGALGGVLSAVTGFIRSHKGPRSADLRLLEPAGLAIMQGLVRGVQGGQPALGRALAGVSGQITGAGQATVAAAAGAAGAGGGAVVIEVRSGGSRLDDLLVDVLKKAIRVRGGNVQVVLGTGS